MFGARSTSTSTSQLRHCLLLRYLVLLPATSTEYNVIARKYRSITRRPTVIRVDKDLKTVEYP